MKSNIPIRHRTAGLTLAGIALIAAVAGARADDFFWNNPDGGTFGDQANWNTGNTGVPGFADAAIFDIYGNYTVQFAQEQATDRLLLRRGYIHFSMPPSVEPFYSIMNPLSITPSIVIGEGQWDDVKLTLGATASMHGHFMEIASDPLAFGMMTVFGTDCSLQLDEHLYVGYGGTGYLNVDSGCLVTNAAAGLALGPESYAEAQIASPGTEWTCDGPLTVGRHGEAILFITTGATVTCDDSILGLEIGASGAVNLAGLGTTWFINGTLDVGMFGEGSLIVENGANVFSSTFATIGTFPHDPPDEEGIGEVVVRDPGSAWWVQGYLYVGYLGDGTLTLAEGGRLHVDDGLYHHFPGWGSTRLVIELGSADDYPDPAIFAGGDIDDFQPYVMLVGGFVPAEGDTFAIAHAEGSLGLFDFQLPDLPYPLDWSVVQTAHDVSLAVISTIVPGDVNGDGVVDVLDMLEVLAAWGACPGCPADLNGDGVVNVLDLLIVLANWS